MYTDRKLLLGLLAILLSARKVTSISRTRRLLPRLRQQPLPIRTRSTRARPGNPAHNDASPMSLALLLLLANLRPAGAFILRRDALFGILGFPFRQVRLVFGLGRFKSFWSQGFGVDVGTRRRRGVDRRWRRG